MHFAITSIGKSIAGKLISNLAGIGCAICSELAGSFAVLALPFAVLDAVCGIWSSSICLVLQMH